MITEEPIINPNPFTCKECPELKEPGEIAVFGKMRSWAGVTRAQIKKEEKENPGFTTYTCKISKKPQSCGKSKITEEPIISTIAPIIDADAEQKHRFNILPA